MRVKSVPGFIKRFEETTAFLAVRNLSAEPLGQIDLGYLAFVNSGPGEASGTLNHWLGFGKEHLELWRGSEVRPKVCPDLIPLEQVDPRFLAEVRADLINLRKLSAEH
jgi:hypothetical protein